MSATITLALGLDYFSAAGRDFVLTCAQLVPHVPITLLNSITVVVSVAVGNDVRIEEV